VWASRLFKRAFPSAVLGCILIAYVISVLCLHPVNFFGLTGDDAVYFSSAKALAAGRGYVLPSVPGLPSARKYPVLYPWLLSWVWRWNPSFPANLTDAIALTMAFGLAFLLAGFVFLRRLKGIDETEALFLTAFCAFHPLVLFYSGSVLSEVPFCAFALGAMLVANRATQREAKNTAAACCGILAGLTILMRMLGVPVVAGILMAFLARRAWRQLFVFCGCLAPCVVGLAWRVIFPRLPARPVTEAAVTGLAWTRAWAYYTSYAEFWKMSVPNSHILWAMLKNNAGMLLRGPADYFLAPMLVRNTLTGRTLVVIVTAAALTGIVRQARRQYWQPIHFVLPFYSVVILFWNFPDVDRFLLPFLPLLAAGLWIEGQHVVGMIWTAIARSPGLSERILASALGLIVVALGFVVGLNYMAARREVAKQSQDRAVFLRGKREAYDWLVRFTAGNARVIAYEDATAYLYTGRVTMPPVVFTTAEFYDPACLEKSVANVTDMARAIGADYWLFAADDFDFVWPEATRTARAQLSGIEGVLPLVFRSRDGSVRIRSLGCVQHPEVGSCGAGLTYHRPQRTELPVGTSEGTARAGETIQANAGRIRCSPATSNAVQHGHSNLGPRGWVTALHPRQRSTATQPNGSAD
jgi:4-amino-4-deoxy-L-arabinose transferase-like glycosyltransferase